MAYTKGLDFTIFNSNEVLKDAILMNLQIVGEGANRINQDIQIKYPQIPWRDMADFRIIFAHIYFKVNFDQIWSIIVNHLPENLKELKIILQQVEKQEKI
jgi:uncharacterized protein with HEPN domain